MSIALQLYSSVTVVLSDINIAHDLELCLNLCLILDEYRENVRQTDLLENL